MKSLTTLMAGMAMAILSLPAFANLPTPISDKIAQTQVNPQDVSIWVKPLDGGTLVMDYHSSTPRIPASTQKLVPTFVALHTLGENHHWFTRIYTRGIQIGSVLHGDVIVKGSGDPSLTHERLNAMLEQLAHKGVKHIKGDIIVDNSAFNNVAYDVYAFDGQGLRAYNAQPNALLINYGTISVDMTPSGHGELTGETNKLGKPITRFVANGNDVAVNVLPKMAEFDFPKMLMGGQACQEPRFSLSKTALSISQPSVGCGTMTYWITMPNGDEFVRRAILGTWQSIDKDFTGQVRVESAKTYGLPIVSYPSKPLSAQIYDINQHSNNVMTEQVALSLPLVTGQAVSDYPSAFKFINDWWQTNMTTQAPVMTRASGLCRNCQIAPKSMGEMLEFAYHQPNFEVFKNSLPIAGQTGTMIKLAQRNPNHPAIGRAFIKTGTLDNVTSMAGYALDTQGKWYVVVGMINSPNVAKSGAIEILDEMLAQVTTH
ncbi:D-alanyl-D-alanine carboxypeptidase/D-alanyl-D-alanine-endopeptidase [Moraxella oblonga]|uniref:D-alanyl-D-alanine carboxypeptidase/D-alanyl-D-alanine-endopeptidase n=1 Tax=Moraxella oblonga TaxID=200413 RepID=UPI0008295265|nr:D-alanyl-D-alanine carboxypeptidase [Moraxella oblonga]